MKARVITAEAKISKEIWEILEEEGKDHKGNFYLQEEDGKRKIRAHPKRILPIRDDAAGVVHNDGTFTAKCPQCDVEAQVDVGKENSSAECSEHGSFQLNWSDTGHGHLIAKLMPQETKSTNSQPSKKAAGSKKQPAAKKQQSSATIDFDVMKKAGELWTKGGVNFDYPEYTVRTHTFIVIDDDETARKYCFNSYNGTWGKKSKQNDVERFIANQPAANGRKLGFGIKGTIEQERKRLEKAKYVREE